MEYLILFISTILISICLIIIIDNYELEKIKPLISGFVIATHLVSMFLIVQEIEKKSYKNGQIDAINGKIKYEHKIKYE